MILEWGLEKERPFDFTYNLIWNNLVGEKTERKVESDVTGITSLETENHTSFVFYILLSFSFLRHRPLSSLKLPSYFSLFRPLSLGSLAFRRKHFHFLSENSCLSFCENLYLFRYRFNCDQYSGKWNQRKEGKKGRN